MSQLRDSYTKYIAHYKGVICKLNKSKLSLESNYNLNKKLLLASTSDKDKVGYIKDHQLISKQLNSLDKLITLTGTHIITYSQYKDILYKYWDSVAKEILKGYYHSSGFGYIFIIALENNHNKMIVDKAESFKYLKELARTINPKDIELYDKGSITHTMFLSRMKSFTYSIETPNLPKWLVYRTDDIRYYFSLKRNFYIPNIVSYKFTPSNFINTYERSQVKFQNAHTLEEIIDSPLLGNRDKLFSVVTKTSTLTDKYKANELFFYK